MRHLFWSVLLIAVMASSCLTDSGNNDTSRKISFNYTGVLHLAELQKVDFTITVKPPLEPGEQVFTMLYSGSEILQRSLYSGPQNPAFSFGGFSKGDYEYRAMVVDSLAYAMQGDMVMTWKAMTALQVIVR
jgi:hypothetical protein